MSSIRIKTWEKTRSKGKKRYIIIYTILLIICGIVYSISNYYFGIYKDLSEFFGATIIYIFSFFVLGLILGPISWKIRETRYKKLLKDQKSN